MPDSISPELMMESRLAVLKLFLDALDVPADISSMAGRKSIQKAVYLGQRAGIDLGYRFGWYIRGPYSPPLATAYYELAEAVAAGEQPGRELRNDLRDRLAPVRDALRLPADVGLTGDDWMELLASLHYLEKVRGLDFAVARETISKEKNRLLPYVERAQGALDAAGLM